MNCRRLRNLLVPYLEGSLSPEWREAVSLHLRECPACDEERASLKGTVALLQATRFPAAEPSLHLWEAVRAKIESPPLPLWQRYRYAMAAPALAAALALVLIARLPQEKMEIPPPESGIDKATVKMQPSQEKSPRVAVNPPQTGSAKSNAEQVFSPLPAPIMAKPSGGVRSSAAASPGISGPAPEREFAQAMPGKRQSDALAPGFYSLSGKKDGSGRDAEEERVEAGAPAPKPEMLAAAVPSESRPGNDIRGFADGPDGPKEGMGGAAGMPSGVESGQRPGTKETTAAARNADTSLSVGMKGDLGTPGTAARSMAASPSVRMKGGGGFGVGGGRMGGMPGMGGGSAPEAAVPSEVRLNLEVALMAESLRDEGRQALFRYP